MKEIFYPGSAREVCRAEYAIIMRKDGALSKADIVVISSIQSGGQSNLPNLDKERDILLNKILSFDLKGIRIDFIRFFIIFLGNHQNDFTGRELKIQFHIEDFEKKQHANSRFSQWLRNKILNRSRSSQDFPVLSYNVVGGDAEFYTKTDNERRLSHVEIMALCTAAEYHGVNAILPK